MFYNKPIIIDFENCGKLNRRRKKVLRSGVFRKILNYIVIFTILDKKPIIVVFEIIGKLN